MSFWPSDDDEFEDLSSEESQRITGRLSAGLLAMAPLLLAYEWAERTLPGERRNLAEVVISLPLAVFGDSKDLWRWGIVGLLLAIAAYRVLRSPRGWLEVVRIPGEGLLAAICIGPLLMFAQSSLGGPGQAEFLPRAGPRQVPPLDVVALRVGGSAYEELLFRLCLLSAAYVLTRHLVSALKAPLPVARWIADLVGLLSSSLLFAAFHLEGVASGLGWSGGEAFSGPLFLWRFLAGLLLGGLFRWRGLGVAAWAHALFNLSLELGAGPAVFR